MATKANLVIDQGATYEVTLDLTDENGDILQLTGYSANAQMRKWYTSTNSTSFSTDINAVAGTISLSLTAGQTANLTAGRYVYDVEVTSSGVISRIIEGIVTVTPNVTR